MSAKVLVYGGSGALGKSLILNAKKMNFETYSIAFEKSDATHDICIKREKWGDCLKDVITQLETKNVKFDAVVNAAGKWGAGSFGMSEDSLIEHVETMYQANTISSVIVSQISAKFLNPRALVVFIGSKVACSSTPSMIGYGLSKAASHQIAQSLSEHLKQNGDVISLLPSIIDTEKNRVAMPNADTSNWTSADEISRTIWRWVEKPSTRPSSGQMIEVITNSGVTSYNAIMGFDHILMRHGLYFHDLRVREYNTIK